MKKQENTFKKIVYKVSPVFAPMIFFAIWEVAAKNNWIDVSVLSSPSEILKTWGKNINNGKFFKYLWISLLRFFEGFIAGSIVGLLLGIVMGLSKKIDHYFSSFTSLLRSIPLIAWVPIAIFALGIGESTRILLVAIGCFWSVFLNTQDGIKSVDNKLLEVAKKFEKGRMYTVVKVVIPAAFPNIVTGLRAGFSNSWRSIVAAEMIGASSGIGYLITYGRETQRPDLMYQGLITIAVLGLLLDIVLIKVQNRMLKKYNKG